MLSIAALFQSQAPRLRRFFARRADRQEAEDLVQETFLRLVAVEQSPSAAIAKPEAYLSRVASNLLRDRARVAFQRSIAAEIPAEDSSLLATNLVASLEARDMLNRLESAMQRLGPKTREIFMAHRLDGFTYREIAERTGLSVKGVEWHMSKAITNLDRVLSQR
ncbi:sigma-70 family RNA polymerase sigma factor [Sphingomonas koreensis]|nr:sigma-70 family RNA polymerase sigma factor [Sphingomonas koreensis]